MKILPLFAFMVACLFIGQAVEKASGSKAAGNYTYWAGVCVVCGFIALGYFRKDA